MTDATAAILVLTGKSLAHILKEAGSSAWVLSRREAQRRPFLVCARNSDTRDPDATEPHRSAFMVGRGLGFQPIEERSGFTRWRITFAEYAAIDMPEVWKSWRNPVRYTTLEALGIEPDELDFRPFEQSQTPELAPPSGPGLSIEDAKAGLALRFGVKPDAIEIIIRG